MGAGFCAVIIERDGVAELAHAVAVVAALCAGSGTGEVAIFIAIGAPAMESAVKGPLNVVVAEGGLAKIRRCIEAGGAMGCKTEANDNDAFCQLHVLSQVIECELIKVYEGTGPG